MAGTTDPVRMKVYREQTARLDRLLKGTATPENYKLATMPPMYGNVGIPKKGYINVGIAALSSAATQAAKAATAAAKAATAAMKAATRKASPPHKGGYRKARRARKTRRRN